MIINPENSASASHNRNGRGVGFDLPDDLEIQILSWLPAKDVVQVRSVCKRWRDLTSSQNFNLLHLQRCLPMVLYPNETLWDQELLDQWWEPPPSKPKTYKLGDHPRYEVLFSNGGLVVTRSSCMGVYRIINPMYYENVHIILPEGIWAREICGVFFHPSLKEYCTLWRIDKRKFTGPWGFKERVEYRILTLGSTPCCRVISNPLSHIDRFWRIPPVLIHEHLYWVLEDSKSSLCGDVMGFDIRKEEFTLIPSPVLGDVKFSELNMNLLDIGGLLSWVWISPCKKPMDVMIWTLKDRAAQLWTRSSYCINTDDSYWYTKPISLVNDELVFNTLNGLFICNLKLCTVRKIENQCYRATSMTSHMMSLASLRNCESHIYMDKIGDVEREKDYEQVEYVNWS